VSWQSAATGDYSYQDGTIVYEWAFSAPQIHPRQALPLSPGEQLGFDVVLLDQSSDGRHRWIPWGTVDTIKDGGNSRVGRVTLTSTVYQASSPQAVAVDGGDLLWVLALAAVAATIVFARRHAAGVDERLTAVERRMTDTQDVLISLAEKLDRLEARESIGVEPDQEGSA
jgi:hypothetical protein